MYSTSSNEFDCSEVTHGMGYENVQPQYYTTLAQPLVYYAQVQPRLRRPSRSQTRKDNPNCFVKAFRWYTQEHRPAARRDLSENPDWSGFTEWLDDKYNQYLSEKQRHSLGQPSPLESIESNNCDRKKRRRVKSKGPSDTVKRSRSGCYSCNFIMKPRDASRPASDCCQLPTSTATYTIQREKQDSDKPRSCTNNLCPNKNETNKSSSNVEIDNKPKQEEKRTSTVVLNKDTLKNTQSAQCQSEQESVKKMKDSESQYAEKMERKTSLNRSTNTSIKESSEQVCPCISKEALNTSTDNIQKKVASKPSNKLRKRSSIQCGCSEATKTYQSQAVQCVCHETPNIQVDSSRSRLAQEQIRPATLPCEGGPCSVLATFKRDNFSSFSNFVPSVDNAEQTSDHSICINPDGQREYPLFMRIIDADKLSTECFCSCK